MLRALFQRIPDTAVAAAAAAAAAACVSLFFQAWISEVANTFTGVNGFTALLTPSSPLASSELA
jgi:hypothetical protein